MKQLILKISSLALISSFVLSVSACTGGSSENAETFTVKELSVWYLASDDTDDYSGDIRAYSTDEYENLYNWSQDNTGKLLTSAEQDSDKHLVLTMTSSQKEELLEIVEKKYQQALDELPDVCSLFERAEISENDPKELDLYFDPDAWLGTDTSTIAGLTEFENLIILEDFWQLKEELENGSDFVGTIKWKNANSGYSLFTFSSDPTVTDSASFATVAVRHTNYSDYEGTLDFTAEYIGTFTDDSYDDTTFYEFEITNDTSYQAGEKVCFKVDSLPVEVNEGDSVYVTFSGDNWPSDYAFTSHDQELCFDEDIPYEMTLVDSAQ